MKKLFRGVAQLVARMVRDHEAASSSLATPTISPQAFACGDFFAFYRDKNQRCSARKTEQRLS